MTSRQQQIQQRKRKNKNQKSKPLTPIWFCDAANCFNILEDDERYACSVCKAFSYCGKECQKAHWVKHRLMCGSNPTPEFKDKLDNYIKARDVAEYMYRKMKDGNYTTVIHEKGDVPASIFTTIATKSNILNWKEYIKNPMFTTTAMSGFGQLAPKIKAAIDKYSDQKVFVYTIIFDRLRENEINETVIRLFVAESYGATMDAPMDGKITREVVKYKRK